MSIMKEFEKATKAEKDLPEHVQEMASGGYVCSHCGGEVDKEGNSAGMDEDVEGKYDGETKVGDPDNEMVAGLFGKAVRER